MNRPTAQDYIDDLPKPEKFVSSSGDFMPQLYAVAVLRSLGKREADEAVEHYLAT